MIAPMRQSPVAPRVLEAHARLTAELGRPPTRAELADAARVRREEIRVALWRLECRHGHALPITPADERRGTAEPAPKPAEIAAGCAAIRPPAMDTRHWRVHVEEARRPDFLPWHAPEARPEPESLRAIVGRYRREWRRQRRGGAA